MHPLFYSEKALGEHGDSKGIPIEWLWARVSVSHFCSFTATLNLDQSEVRKSKGMGRVWAAALKELIYGQTFTISVQLISQGTQEVSNVALDIQVGLQKKSFV